MTTRLTPANATAFPPSKPRRRDMADIDLSPDAIAPIGALLDVVEQIDSALSALGNRELVSTAEVLNLLLDMRNTSTGGLPPSFDPVWDDVKT
jgi:hypothetical protein